MTFVAPLALLVLLAVVGPLVAHALRQGRGPTLPFPAARFVRTQKATTKERRRLQDRSLLAIRILSLVGLAALGATPLASCSRLALNRDRGASVAVVLIIDDSASMQVEDEGRSRLERALSGARDLLVGTRTGDAIGVVLAGRPARLLLSPTTDLGRAKGALAEIGPSDRPTDLDAALVLADDALARLPQADKQIVVLSDLATPETLTQTKAELSIPLPDLARPFDNCGLVRARREPGHVSVEIACSAGSVRTGRQVELRTEAGAKLAAVDLVESVSFPLADDAGSNRLTVHLTEPNGAVRDQVPGDDRVDVEPRASDFTVALYADPKQSGLPTSGTTVLKAALEALDQELTIRPITVLPDHGGELEGIAAILVDDPPGLTPEASSVLEEFTLRGGVVLALLGRQVQAAPLGAVFQPLVAGAPSWSDGAAPGVDPESTGAFGSLAKGWTDLGAKGRVVLAKQPDDTRLALAFADGQPLLLERPLGQGLILTTLLPSSVAVSDFALRPAFLGLLDRVLYEARLRTSFAATEVGQPWEVAAGTTAQGPDGAAVPRVEAGRSFIVPSRAGRYSIRTGSNASSRFALRNADETTLQPRPAPTQKASGGAVSARQSTDISREIALALLVLMVLELGLRAYKKGQGLRPRAGQGALL